MGKLLRISYLEHKTIDWVQDEMNFLVGPQEPLLANVKETETCMVRACHTPRQRLQTRLSGHVGGGDAVVYKMLKC